MAQAGFTPISLYFSTTAAATPSAGNLVAGELALNTVDEKLYFKNSAGTVKLLASNATSAPVLSFQTSLGGLTPSTATTGVVTLAGTLNTTSGGTGLTSFTAGDVPYYASGSVLSKLAIGTAGQFLTSTGTAPQWSTLSGVAVTTFSAGTTGFTPSSATSGAVTLAGTLATTNGGTGLTSFTSGGVVYASSSSALATGSALIFDGTNLGIGNTSPTSYNSAADNLVIGTSGNNGMTIVSGSTSSGYIMFADGTTGQQAYEGQITYDHTSNFMAFNTSAVEGLRLTSSSLYTASGINVGIGTSSPNAKLNSQGTAGDPASSGSTQAGNMLRASNTATGAILDIGVSNTGSRYGWLQATNSSDLSINYDLVLNKNGGNVGIGTSSPAMKLDVNGGDIRATSTSATSLYLKNTSASGKDYRLISADSGNFIIQNTGVADLVFLSSAGNISLLQAPSAFGYGGNIQVPGGGRYLASIGNDIRFGGNVYNDGSLEKYAADGFSEKYRMANGQHQWFNAPNNTSGAGATISFTQAMTLDASGNLMVGSTSSSATANKNIDVNGTGDAAFVVRVGGTTTSYLYSTAGQTILGTVGALPITFNPNNTERGRFTTTGLEVTGTLSVTSNVSTVGNLTVGSSGNGDQKITTLQGYSPNAVNGSYGSLLFSANTNATGGARRFLLTNALDYTSFAIICSVDANTTPTLDVNAAVSSGTAAFVIKTNATAIFNSVVSVGNATPATSGAGITFPATQSASSNANTLDDYEEGTWTPSLGGTTTYDRQDGNYTKVGRLVNIRCNIMVLLIGTGSTFQISGLPFTTASTAIGNPPASGVVGYFASLAVSPVYISVIAASGGTTMNVSGLTAAGATANASLGVFGNSARIDFTMTYYTD